MKKLLFFLLLSQSVAFAQTTHVVISQVYGGGGNTDAPFTHDFVELYNPTTSAVNLTGFSLQYSSATGSSWSSNKFDLTGTIDPGKYFLIQLASSGSIGSSLPTPDVIVTSPNINMGAGTGKVALVNNTNLLTGNCPLGASIIDFVGFGGADCKETAVAKAPSASTAIIRTNNGCTDTDNNLADFTVGTPSPRNSNSPANFCNQGSVVVTSTFSAPFCVDAANNAVGNIQFTAIGSFSNTTFRALLSDVNGGFASPVAIGTTTVTGINPSGSISIAIPAAIPSSLNYRLRVDAVNPSFIGTQSTAFEVINGAKNINTFKSAAQSSLVKLIWINPTGCFDEIMIVAKEAANINAIPTGDGTNFSADLNFAGSGTAFDGGKVVYKGTTSGQSINGLTDGKTYYFKAFTRRGTNWSAGIETQDKPRTVPNAGELLINQFSPQFSSNASDEFIELVNVTDKTFDLSDVRVRYQSSSGTVLPDYAILTGTMLPHSYWLLCPSGMSAITVGKTQSLPADGNFRDGIALNAGIVTIVRGADNLVLDAVGFGNVAVGTFTEGSAAPAPTSYGGLIRKTEGIDNNNNSIDFIKVANVDIELRNSQSRLANANASIAAGNYKTIFVTGNAQLVGDVTVTDKVMLTNGKLSLNNYNITTENITGGGGANYIQTNGTGSLVINNISTSSKAFPVGSSTYNPVTINNGSGLAWTVHVSDSINYSNTPFTKSKAINRTWNVTPSASPTTGATVAFEYNENDATQLGTDFVKNDHVQLWNLHTAIWQSAGSIQIPVLSNGMKKVTLTNQTQFSPFVIANPSTVLPVHFTAVKGFLKSSGAQIEFTNSTESDVQYYVIESSVDGQHFKTLTQLQPKLNDGSASSYVYTDTNAAGENYYRIKAVETSGNVIYSTVISIGKKGFENLIITPNIITNKTLNIQASLLKGAYKMLVINSNGNIVYQQSLQQNGNGNFFQSVNLPTTLPAGHYMLQIIGDGKHFLKPFILAQ